MHQQCQARLSDRCISNARRKPASAMPIRCFGRADESISYSADESNIADPKSVRKALRNLEHVTRVFVSQVRGSSRYLPCRRLSRSCRLFG